MVVVRVRILSMPPPIHHTCENAFMWLKHLYWYDHSYKSGHGKRSLCYPDEPHFITQPLKSRKPPRMRFRKMQHGRTLPAIAGFEDDGRRLQAKGIGCLQKLGTALSWQQRNRDVTHVTFKNWIPPTTWIRKSTNSPLEPLEKSVALLIVWFQLSETMLDFWLTEAIR